MGRQDLSFSKVYNFKSKGVKRSEIKSAYLKSNFMDKFKTVDRKMAKISIEKVDDEKKKAFDTDVVSPMRIGFFEN